MDNKIPVTNYNYIDYNGEIFIIEPDTTIEPVSFQIDGTMCRQMFVSGTLYKSFKSSSKYFNPNFWYKKTSWTCTKERIFFNEQKHHKITNILSVIGDSKSQKKLEEYAVKHSKPVINILASIKKNVEKHIGSAIEFDFKYTEYGNHWYEAYIPIKIKNKRYILTWENCD